MDVSLKQDLASIVDNMFFRKGIHSVWASPGLQEVTMQLFLANW